MPIQFEQPLVPKIAEVSIEGPLGVTEKTLSTGFTSIAHSLAPKHALQQSLAALEDMEFARKSFTAKNTLGLHMQVRMNCEREISRMNGRIGGLKSKLLTKDLVRGTEDDIDLDDVFSINPSINSAAMKQPYEFMDI